MCLFLTDICSRAAGAIAAVLSTFKNVVVVIIESSYGAFYSIFAINRRIRISSLAELERAT